MSDAKREAVEAVRLWNSDCPTSIKTASELAAVNILVSNIDRATIVALVTEARAIVGAKS